MKDDVLSRLKPRVSRLLDAGPRIPAPMKLKLPPLDNAARQRLADSLGPHRADADRRVLSRTVTDCFVGPISKRRMVCGRF